MDIEKVITRESNERYELVSLERGIVVVYSNIDVYQFGKVCSATALLE